MSLPGPENITRHQLSNGIVVLVYENHTSPSVVIDGYLSVGAYDEDPKQAGLSSFTAEALMRGAGNRTFDQIYEALESVAASIDVSGATHTTSFGTKSLVDDLPLTLDVLADVLRRPTFPEPEVEKLRGELLTYMEKRAHNTGQMAHLAFYELAYPQNHPYASSVTGYVETINHITRDDLYDFHSGGYGPQGMVIALVGDIETQDALSRIEAAFGDWVGAAYDREPLPKVPRISDVRQRFVPIPGKSQSDLVLGYPGPARTSPDYLDAVVCNCVLGIFGLMGRLGENVREAQGLAYYSYSRVSGGPGPGSWRIIAGVDPGNVERAVDSIRQEIARMCNALVDQDELSDNKRFITGSLPLRLETNTGVAQYITDMERYALGLDYLQRYDELINGVTADQVQAVAQRWLDPDAYALGVAGPPSEEAPC